MYHKKSFLYGLTRPSLSRCDLLCCLKLFLRNGSLSQLLFRRLFESKNERKKLLLFDNDGNGNCIKTPDANNRTFGLLNTDNDYPDGRVKY